MKLKLITIIMLILFTGCSRIVPIEILNKSAEICAPNGGIKYIEAYTITATNVVCKNNVQFSIRMKGDGGFIIG